nr:hypothetical protein [Abalone asfa-like virus]
MARFYSIESVYWMMIYLTSVTPPQMPNDFFVKIITKRLVHPIALYYASDGDKLCILFERQILERDLSILYTVDNLVSKILVHDETNNTITGEFGNFSISDRLPYSVPEPTKNITEVINELPAEYPLPHPFHDLLSKKYVNITTLIPPLTTTLSPCPPLTNG